MQLDPADPRLPSRPMVGLLILALPLVGVVLVALGYAGLFVLGLGGRSASGGELTLSFAGCPEAEAVVEARLLDMGLPHKTLPPQPDRFGFTLTLPSDPAVAGGVPATLVAPGQLELMGGEERLADNSDVRGASVRMDLLLEPSLLLELDADAAERVRAHVNAHPQGRLTLRLDSAAVASQHNATPVQVGEVELMPIAQMPERQRWAAVAEWAVVADYALPCAVTLAP